MVVSVFRGRVWPGKQAEFKEKVEQSSVPFLCSQPGLLAYYPGQPMADGPDEFVMVTVWESLDALKAFAGEDWENPVITGEEFLLLEAACVDHYEVFGRNDA